MNENVLASIMATLTYCLTVRLQDRARNTFQWNTLSFWLQIAMQNIQMSNNNFVPEIKRSYILYKSANFAVTQGVKTGECVSPLPHKHVLWDRFESLQTQPSIHSEQDHFHDCVYTCGQEAWTPSGVVLIQRCMQRTIPNQRLLLMQHLLSGKSGPWSTTPVQPFQYYRCYSLRVAMASITPCSAL